MPPIARSILAIVAGVVAWGLLWNLSFQVGMRAMPDELAPDQPIENAGALLAYLVISVLLSVVAGYLAAWIKGPDPMRTVWVLAFLQLFIGIFVQLAISWEIFPLWYHIPFLALVVPAHVFGGRLRAPSHTALPATP